MGKIISGTFDGTGAALVLGIGFMPDWVKIWNEEDTVDGRVFWSKHMGRAADYPEGIEYYTGTVYIQHADLAFGAGIRRYKGGDKVTSLSTTYLVRDDTDYRTSTTYGTITTWTLDTAATPTGHFNLEADTTYVGEGSTIMIDGYEYHITAMTSNGEQTDEVTLNEAAPTGVVEHLGRIVDYAGAPANTIIPAGFQINATSVINVSGERCFFEAGTYDN